MAEERVEAGSGYPGQVLQVREDGAIDVGHVDKRRRDPLPVEVRDLLEDEESCEVDLGHSREREETVVGTLGTDLLEQFADRVALLLHDRRPHGDGHLVRHVTPRPPAFT